MLSTSLPWPEARRHFPEAACQRSKRARARACVFLISIKQACVCVCVCVCDSCRWLPRAWLTSTNTRCATVHPIAVGPPGRGAPGSESTAVMGRVGRRRGAALLARATAGHGGCHGAGHGGCHGGDELARDRDEGDGPGRTDPGGGVSVTKTCPRVTAGVTASP
jgi:hypothetical protein